MRRSSRGAFRVLRFAASPASQVEQYDWQRDALLEFRVPVEQNEVFLPNLISAHPRTG